MEYNLKHFAYLGDAVYELFIRELTVQKTQSQKKMHELTTKYVCANFQAEIISALFDKLSDDELEIQKRGRNLKITINKKNNPKIHALATSFEVLIGYLYINNKVRLDEIFTLVADYIDNKN